MAQRVYSRLLAIVAALVLVASACTSSSQETKSAEDQQSSQSQGEETGSGSDGLASLRDEPAPPESFDGEPVGSALFGDRNDPAFPPPLIDPADIQSGGPPPDGIPSIDNPIFASVSDTDYLSDEEAVIVVEYGGQAKAYPVQVLIWHEIVNDTVGGEPITVTYCPLCNSALAFKRSFGSRVLDFGTSGELYQSALVMYDRQTESLWAHFTGQGIVGHFSGAQLELVPAQTLSYAAFAARYPDGLVLTTDTGFNRSYGLNPYVGYDDEATDPIGEFITQDIDDRLPPKTRVVGVLAPGGPVTVTLEDLSGTGVYELDAKAAGEGGPIVLFHAGGLMSSLDSSNIDEGRDVGQTGAYLARSEDGTNLTFTQNEDGQTFVDAQTGSTWAVTGNAIDGELEGQQLIAVPLLDTFWFAWSTYRPDASLVTL